MKNVVFLCNKIFPINSGDSLYNYGLCNEFSKYCNLHVISFGKEYEDKIENFDYRIFDFVTSKKNKFDETVIKYINAMNKTNEIDIIFLSHIDVMYYYKPLKKSLPHVKFIYISHNVEAINKKQSLKREKSFGVFNKLKEIYKYERIKYYEKELLNCSNIYFTISTEDYKQHLKLYHKIGKPIFCKPLISFENCKSKERLTNYNKKLLIAGSMNWYPNVEGIKWFVNTVFSKIVSDGYILYLAGANPSSELYELKNKYPKNIIITGLVDSMDEYFQKCDISIIPLFSGTGAKIKVLESIGRGIPTICTSFAAKDYKITDEVIIADSADEFMRSIRQIEEDITFRIMMNEKMKMYYDKYMNLSEDIINILKD